jgi:hypothetical protein
MSKTDKKTITIEQAESLAIAYRAYGEAKRRGLKGDLDIWRKMLWQAQYQTRVYLEPMWLLECGKNLGLECGKNLEKDFLEKGYF